MRREISLMNSSGFSLYNKNLSELISFKISTTVFLVRTVFSTILPIKFEIEKNDTYKDILDEFKSNLINSYYLLGTYKNKYTIRYVLGSNNKTLEQKDLQSFKERFIEHIKNNGLNIIE